ncbi:MAG: hypothetical protein QG637_622 [Chloroflexota bacterium]|nr:hypothetical protein [Chloroflexota bacterium]
MIERILTLRELNRATLARQMLLERATVSAPAAIERLVGLQAQLPVAPYVGLWTRLTGFRRDDLATAIVEHGVVKATTMRATLHLLTAEDYLRFRATLQPMLTYAGRSIAKRRGGNTIDVPALLALAREYIAEQPRTFEEISAMLAERLPDHDIGALRYTVRTHLPLTQTPTDARWSYPGNPHFALAEAWLGRPISPEEDLKALVFRYLAAFGPASVQDVQTWSGFPKLKEAIGEFKADLRVYRDERGRELLDLPDTPLVDEATPAPVRFLPEYDNLLLSHQNRTRVIPEKHHAHVFLAGLRVAATILVDGFVAGAWKIEKAKGAATLTITPFEPLAQATRDALAEEGERLARFVEADAKAFEVRFGDTDERR